MNVYTYAYGCVYGCVCGWQVGMRGAAAARGACGRERHCRRASQSRGGAGVPHPGSAAGLRPAAAHAGGAVQRQRDHSYHHSFELVLVYYNIYYTYIYILL